MHPVHPVPSRSQQPCTHVVHVLLRYSIAKQHSETHYSTSKQRWATICEHKWYPRQCASAPQGCDSVLPPIAPHAALRGWLVTCGVLCPDMDGARCHHHRFHCWCQQPQLFCQSCLPACGLRHAAMLFCLQHAGNCGSQTQNALFICTHPEQMSSN